MSICSTYQHKFNKIDASTSTLSLDIQQTLYRFQTKAESGKVGLMLVGMGGNNGTTIIGGLLANKLNIEWHTKSGLHKSNMYGSMTQNSTMKVGETEDREVFMKIKEVLPLLDPTALVFGGWDINGDNLAQAMQKAQVFDYDLQAKLKDQMAKYQPLPSIYYKDFIAENQIRRVNNILNSDKKEEHLRQIQEDIREFKSQNSLDKVIVLWTANTERFTQIGQIHQNYASIRKAIEQSEPEISPSTIFAIAAMEEDCVFINGSPQNTFLPGMDQIQKGLYIGNDFKTGQTKFKTAFMDFLTGAGIKPKSIVSYNHLGNNDGKNLSSEKQFKSKETSKSKCIEDILDNSLLFEAKSTTDSTEQAESATSGPDHTVVIKYVPSAGDSKKAIDEYVSEIFMGGEHSFVSYNVCEDSLLAAGIIIDLIVMSELLTRVSYTKGESKQMKPFQGVVSFLGYLMKAPESTGPVINSLSRQRSCIENLIRILRGLPLQDNLLLNFRV